VSPRTPRRGVPYSLGQLGDLRIVRKRISPSSRKKVRSGQVRSGLGLGQTSKQGLAPKIYLKTQTGNPFREDSEGETALIANPSGDVEKGILKILLEAEELITARDNEAKVEYVVRTMETITRRGGNKAEENMYTYYRTMRRRNRIRTRRSFKN
jgi:hypothetical protein